MAHSRQSNSSEQHKQHARPEDPKTNTRPPGNGEREQPDARRAEQKLHEISGH